MTNFLNYFNLSIAYLTHRSWAISRSFFSVLKENNFHENMKRRLAMKDIESESIETLITC